MDSYFNDETGIPRTRHGDIPWIPYEILEIDADDLKDWTVKWMATLPAAIRPLELGKRYPRIANQLAAVWSDPQISGRFLETLLVEHRAGRQGFPLRVSLELEGLAALHNNRMTRFNHGRNKVQRHSGLPDPAPSGRGVKKMGAVLNPMDPDNQLRLLVA